ncbi:MAG TPA: carbonic anhydrase [Verrucomicrobiae bacterium]|nr:carbonic anhydrase [Verrucomicrobiae bacterium]
MTDDDSDLGRAQFLRATALGLGATSMAGELLRPMRADAAGGGPPMAASTPAEALAALKAGNARFAAGKPQCGPVTARVAELANGQNPFAIVLGCSDSRVPVETVFDQPPGDVFVVRVAGNFLTDDGLGSIEYAVAVLKSKLILVLGHSSCGAVNAAVGFVRDGAAQPGHIQELVTAIEPAAVATKGEAGDWLSNAVHENVKRNVAAVTARSSIVADAAKSGSLQVVGGVYDLKTGTVTFS